MHLQSDTEMSVDRPVKTAAPFPKGRIAAMLFGALVIIMLAVPILISLCNVLVFWGNVFGGGFGSVVYALFDLLGCLAPVIPATVPFVLIAFGFFAKRKDVACAGAGIWVAYTLFDCISTTGNAFYYYVNAFTVFESFWLVLMALCLFGALLFAKKPVVAKILAALLILTTLIMLLCNGISQIMFWFFERNYYVQEYFGACITNWEWVYADYGNAVYDLMFGHGKTVFEICLMLLEKMFDGNFLSNFGLLSMLLLSQLMYPVTAVLIGLGCIGTAVSVFFVRKAPAVEETPETETAEEGDEPTPVEDESAPVDDEPAPVEDESAPVEDEFAPVAEPADAEELRPAAPFVAEPVRPVGYTPAEEPRVAPAAAPERPVTYAPARPVTYAPAAPARPARPMAPFGGETAAAPDTAPAAEEAFEPAAYDKDRPTTSAEVYGQDMAALKRYQELLDAGIISEEEFEARRKSIFGL